MSFKELYGFCQSQTTPVSTKIIKQKILQITGVQKVAVVKTSINVIRCRGYYLSAQNKENRLVQQHGSDVIVLARELNRCWERLVLTKELMHLFDTSENITDSSDKLERVLIELQSSGAIDRSEQTISEISGLFMALAVLCPEKTRLEFQKQYEQKHINEYGIALQLKIPQQYIPLLLRKNYPATIADLLK